VAESPPNYKPEKKKEQVMSEMQTEKKTEDVAVYRCNGTFYKNAGALGKIAAPFKGLIFKIPAAKLPSEARSVIRGTLFELRVRHLIAQGDPMFEGYAGLRELWFESIDGLSGNKLPINVMSNHQLERIVQNEELPVELGAYPDLQTRRDAVQRGKELMLRLASVPLDTQNKELQEFKTREAALIKRIFDRETLLRLNGLDGEDDSAAAKPDNTAVEDLTGVKVGTPVPGGTAPKKQTRKDKSSGPQLPDDMLGGV